MSDKTPPEILPPGSEADINLNTRESPLPPEIALPINGEIDIPDFKSWINWNGFSFEEGRGGHKGFDFAAYLTKSEKIVLGLPKNTQVRAIADGVVTRVRKGLDLGVTDYYSDLNLEHSGGVSSTYAHLLSGVKEGDEVKKGEIVGVLYSTKDNDVGFLTHLHLQLTNTEGELIDPKEIDEKIVMNTAEPQGKKDFAVCN